MLDQIERLGERAIAEVRTKEATGRHCPAYGERPTCHMVRLHGENRWRRVYAYLAGNVSVVYVKVKGRDVYCETALEYALNTEWFDGMACECCAVAIANGDGCYCGDDHGDGLLSFPGVSRWARARGWEDYRTYAILDDNGEDGYTDAFSGVPCGACGMALAGTRYGYTLEATRIR